MLRRGVLLGIVKNPALKGAVFTNKFEKIHKVYVENVYSTV